MLHLKINLGQYTNTALENCLCEFCEKYITEDENTLYAHVHFIMI